MISQQPVIAPAIMADEWDVLVSQIERIACVASRVQIDLVFHTTKPY